MKTRQRRLLAAVVTLAILAVGVSVYAQVSRPYRNGSVWTIAFVRVKPGMDAAYRTYLAGQWKNVQEAAKKEGLTLSYKVLVTEGHASTDWNLLLMTEYKDLAALEASESKMDALEQKMVGDDQKQMQGYVERGDLREIVGDRQARENLF